MIVREIKELKEIPIAFDYFNDYKDTRSWCLHNCPEVVPKLDVGFTAYNNYIRG